MDDHTRRTFAALGTCDNGDCTYTSTDTACPFGCELTYCKGDPCASVTCDHPPAATCTNATTLRTYPAVGTCSNSLCSYAPIDTVCDQPPPPDCAGPSSIRTYSADGTCSFAACQYTATFTSCPQPPNATATCVNGECPITKCATGFADCDGVLANGCEANLLTSATDCGSCGAACTTGDTCYAGSCQLVWQTQSSGSTSWLRGVWGSASNDVYVVGGSGTILHSSNSGATWLARNSATTATLYGVWGSGSDDIYAVGTAGRIFHSADGGTTWTPQTSGTTSLLYAVWGSGSSDVFIAGAAGVMLHSANGGVTWTPQTVPTSLDLHSIWGFGSGDIFAGGEDGTILHSTNHGATWASQPNPSLYAVNGFWGGAPGDLFAVAGQVDIINGIATTFAGLVHTGNGGGSWTSQTPGPSPSTQLNAIWGSAVNNVYVVGNSGKLIRTVDGGTNWIRVVPAGSTLSAIWGSGPRDIYAVGVNGLIMHGH